MKLVNNRDEFIPTRQSLLGRLKDWGDQESWKEFFETYWKLIYSAALKSGLSDAEAQDVVQETVLSVAKKMPDFTYNPAVGSFKHWMLQLTGWRIYRQLQKRLPVTGEDLHRPAGTDETSAWERIPDPAGGNLEQIWDEEWEKNMMDAAIERVKRNIDPKQYQLFDLYVLKQWPIREVTKTLKVSAGRVYIAKHRISSLIKKELNRFKAKTA